MMWTPLGVLQGVHGGVPAAQPKTEVHIAPKRSILRICKKITITPPAQKKNHGRESNAPRRLGSLFIAHMHEES